jgi:hypothetical protein
MEMGFYHPEMGYWQTTGEPSSDVLKSYPKGTTTFPLKPGENYEVVNGQWVKTAPSSTTSDYENAIQALVDQTAQSRNFRDGVTLASYAASTNLDWAAEAVAFIRWRDITWAYAYQELARVLAGEREQPTVEEFLAELTEPNWP